MTDLAKLVVRLEAQYRKELDAATKKMDRFGKRTKRTVKGVNVAFAGLAVAAFTKKIISATAKQEAAVKQLEQGLKSTANVVGFSLKSLTQQAAELQKVTTFGDEDIISAQSKLVTFTNITGEQFKKTTAAVLDLSARMGTDLTSSVVQLGKALNDPVKNLSALSRSGIQFSDSQTKMIKSLIESNKLMEAQDIILKEFSKQFGGSAVAAADAFGGALRGLGNDLGDLFESNTGLPAAAAAVKELRAQVQDPEFQKGFETITVGAITAFTAIVSGATKATVSMQGLVALVKDEVTASSKLAVVESRLSVAQSNLDQGGRRSKAAGLRVKRLQAQVEKLKDVGAQTLILADLEAKLLEVRESDLRASGKRNKISKLKEEIALTQQQIELAKTLASPAVGETESGSGNGKLTPATGDVDSDSVTSSSSQTQFDAIVTSLLSEEDQIAKSYARRRAIVEQNTIEGSARRAELLAGIREQEAAAQLEREGIEFEDKQLKFEGELSAFATHQRSITDALANQLAIRLGIDEQASDAQLNVLKQTTAKAYALLVTSGKKGQKIHKAMRVAETIQSTYSAAMNSYNALSPIPIVGPALGAAAAGVAIAFGAKQVSAIKSGGGGGGSPAVPSVSTPSIPSGGTSADITEIGSAPQREINVIINDAIDLSGTRRILEAVNEALGDGA